MHACIHSMPACVACVRRCALNNCELYDFAHLFCTAGERLRARAQQALTEFCFKPPARRATSFSSSFPRGRADVPLFKRPAPSCKHEGAPGVFEKGNTKDTHIGALRVGKMEALSLHPSSALPRLPQSTPSRLVRPCHASRKALFPGWCGRGVPCRAVPRRAVPCRAVACREAQGLTVPRRAVPWRAVGCSAVPSCDISSDGIGDNRASLEPTKGDASSGTLLPSSDTMPGGAED